MEKTIEPLDGRHGATQGNLFAYEPKEESKNECSDKFDADLWRKEQRITQTERETDHFCDEPGF